VRRGPCAAQQVYGWPSTCCVNWIFRPEQVFPIRRNPVGETIPSQPDGCRWCKRICQGDPCQPMLISVAALPKRVFAGCLWPGVFVGQALSSWHED
jgi:hypothetical protein